MGTVLIGAAAGCSSTRPWHWPWYQEPKKAEEFVLPPESEARFSEPTSYPKYTLNSRPKKKEEDPAKQMGGMRAPTSSGAMGMPGR